MERRAVTGIFGQCLAGLLILASAPAIAAEEDGTCRNGSFPVTNSEFGRAEVQGKGRAWFHDDMDGCPSTSASCRHGYVLPHDVVVTGRTRNGYICAYYQNKVGGTAGWIEESRLRPLPENHRPAAVAWVGAWSDEGNPAFRITKDRRGKLHIDGEAYWPGPDREEDWPLGWPHSGGVQGSLIVNGNRGVVDDGWCRVEIVLLEDTLVAMDNENCGGANVSFDGVYRRNGR